jgi:hypothetical protein
VSHNDARERQIRFYVLAGVVMATFFTAWITILYLVGGRRVFEELNTSFLAALISYFAAGIIGGALVGLLQPLARTLVGTMIVGAIASLVVCLSAQTTLKGAIWTSNRPTLITTILIAIVVGFVLGPLAAREVRR